MYNDRNTMTNPQPTTHTPEDTPSALRGWLMLFAASFLLYGLTSNRGAQWQDSGEHIWRIITGNVLNERGLALSHPLHYYLGRLANAPGLRAPAHAITLVSALAGAVAVANAYGCVLTLTRCRIASAVAAISLALAHTIWQMATITETYTLVIALLSAELWALVLFQKTGKPKFALFMALMNGLGIANHMLASLTTPLVLGIAIGALMQKRLSIKHMLAGAGLWLLGSLPYSALVFTEWRSTGDLSGTLSSALFGRDFAPAVMQFLPNARNAAVTVSFVLLNFPNLLLPLAVVGMRSAWRNRKRRTDTWLLALVLVIHAGFAARYNVIDQHTFFLPTYLLLCMLGGVGLANLLDKATTARRRTIIMLAAASLAITPIIYAVAPRMARSLGVLSAIERHKPYRDDYTYLLTPWSFEETSADRMGRRAEELAADGAVIIFEDAMAKGALRYHLRRREPGVIKLMPASDVKDIQALAAKSVSIVLVPRDRNAPATPAPNGGWHRNGDLYTDRPNDPKPGQ